MVTSSDLDLTKIIGASAHTLSDAAADFDPILDCVGESRLVLIGEASHGTHEFYAARAEITRRLIADRGFVAVAVEADWPDAARVNRFVRGRPGDRDALGALGGFERFPRWMWRNTEVLDFITWLHAWNDDRPETRRVGFYGLDLYSMHASMHAVVEYLRGVDPAAAERARERYACFDHAQGDPQAYGQAAGLGLTEPCEGEAIRQLVDLRLAAAEYAGRASRREPDAQFIAEQNARLVVNAERYYREMFRGRVSSWNLRDSHMAETLQALEEYLTRGREKAKIVVWAHNSHLGDARATEMGAAGEHNLGQLVRERVGDEATLIGFTTAEGTVTAAKNWDESARRMRVRPAAFGSYEGLFHEIMGSDFLLVTRGNEELTDALAMPRLERAIGVIYRPATERQSHYFHAFLSRQFDAIIHYDVTRALEPLDRGDHWTPDQDLPETFPSAL